MRKHFLLLFLLCLCMAFGALADTGTAICMEKFMQNANADGTPKILYTGVAKISMSMRSQADKDSASLGLLKEGNDSLTLTEQDIATTIEYLVRLHAGDTTMTAPDGTEIPVETDDIDHFGNRRLRTVGELIQKIDEAVAAK